MREIFSDPSPVVSFEPQFLILVLLADSAVFSQQVAET